VLLRALSPVLLTLGACAPAVPERAGPSPVPILTSDVFVLDRDQHLICLSDCRDPKPDPNATYQNVRGLGRFSCAVRTDGRAECWGPYGFGDLVPDERFRDATAYLGQACGITEAGEVLCWGDRAEEVARHAPAGPWDQIETTGRDGYCVWSRGGAVGCFGRGLPAEFSSGYQTFHVDHQVGCGLVGDGEVDCFLGLSSYQAPRHFVRALDVAAYFECVLMMETHAHKEGSLLCTGDEPYPEGEFAQLSLSGGNGCVVTEDDEVLCWGYDFETVQSFGTFPSGALPSPRVLGCWPARPDRSPSRTLMRCSTSRSWC